MGVLFSLATPNYWAAIVLLLVFSIELRWFPVGGFGTTFGDHLRHLLLPALTIALSLVPILVRTLRHNILEVLRTEYVQHEHLQRLVVDAACKRCLAERCLRGDRCGDTGRGIGEREHHRPVAGAGGARVAARAYAVETGKR